MRHVNITCLPYNREKDKHFTEIPTKYTHPQSNHEKIQEKPKLRNIVKNNWSVFIKNMKVMKERKSQKKKDQRSEFIRLRSYNNSKQCGIPEPKKDATEQQALFHNVCRLVNNITAMLISWFWYSHCGYVKNICIRENLRFLQLSYKSKIIPRQKAF